MKNQIGVIGMGVMGKNLALNIESRGYSVALYNRTKEKTEAVIAAYPQKALTPANTIQEFVELIEKPRRILLMVQAGTATDATIEALLPYLDREDILIDGGNTFFQDTIRRSEALQKSGIDFVGAGISGGEVGALRGPSIMPGGQRKAYERVAPILKEIAAKANGEPCIAYMGKNGAGHYVKMVHNGIEYGDMQLIAESYDLLRQLVQSPVEELAQIFKEWNKGELNSYLIEITAEIFTKKDDLGTGEAIIDKILDSAGNKGTGKWTSQSALDLGVPLPLITESVFARYISAYKEERVIANDCLPKPAVFTVPVSKEVLIEKIREALYFSKIMSYAQGFAQLTAASETYGWAFPLNEVAKIWRAGCIIRAQFLQKITQAYEKNPKLSNLLLDDYFISIAEQYQQSAREIVAWAVQAGIPVPTFSSAISYYDSYRSKDLPANLIQAQRDYFGAHTYERKDQAGVFHYDWNT